MTDIIQIVTAVDLQYLPMVTVCVCLLALVLKKDKKCQYREKGRHK